MSLDWTRRDKNHESHNMQMTQWILIILTLREIVAPGKHRIKIKGF